MKDFWNDPPEPDPWICECGHSEDFHEEDEDVGNFYCTMTDCLCNDFAPKDDEDA